VSIAATAALAATAVLLRVADVLAFSRSPAPGPSVAPRHHPGAEHWRRLRVFRTAPPIRTSRGARP